MATPVKIVGSDGQVARVSRFGQLTVSAVDYSTPVVQSMLLTDTAYNLVEPSQDRSIVITDIILTANKSVGANDATVEVYEAESATTTSVFQSVLSLEMQKNSNLPLTGLNLIVPPGLWVNAKTDDDVVFVTLMYYRVPVEV